MFYRRQQTDLAPRRAATNCLASKRVGIWHLCAVQVTLSVIGFVTVGCTGAPYPGAYPVAGAPVATGSAPVQAPTTGPASVYAQQQTNPQLMDLQRRVQQLDETNRQLTSQVAQAQQQAQAYQERAELLSNQLAAASEQNRQLLAQSQQYANQAQGMQASLSQMQQAMQLRGGARLTANNSLNSNAGSLQIAGAQVVADHDVIRIRVPSDQLFAPNTAQLNPTSSTMLDQIANALIRQYPRQRVGIEGHTDTAQYPTPSGTTYQLAGAQAQAVLDQLVRRNGVPSQQLFVLAHGPNHPLADNQSPAGRAENRRMEIVIYPETF